VWKRLLLRARERSGYTLTELLVVMAIFLTIVSSLTSLFISGARAELGANRRFQAQENARLAVDKMRREIHCASALTLTSAASVSVTLPAGCPSAAGTQTTVVYDTALVSANRFVLRRTKSGRTVTIGDYLTGGNIFSYTAPTPSALGQLHVDATVNVYPNEAWKKWRLVSDIVLRNTARA
jgi:prepilin-type N-terminal cleavage/methylation domain-containing protein